MTEFNESSRRSMNRRDFLKITAAAATIVAGGGLIGWMQRSTSVQQTRLLMGTVVNLKVVAEDAAAAEAAVQATFAEMERLIGIYTHRQSSSPLSVLNATGELSNPPAELVNVLRKAVYFSQISDGAFDVTVKPVVDAYQQGQALSAELLALVDHRHLQLNSDLIRFGRPGMQVTLDGIAKGSVVDGGVAVLRGLGFSNVLVEAGGDLVANGGRDANSPWKVGIENPRSSGNVLATLSVQGRAAATSGDYMHAFTEDYSLNHIIVPSSGLSPAELSSATVLAPTATEADALATTLMVLGIEKGLALVGSLPGIEAMLINKSLETFVSPGFPQS